MSRRARTSKAIHGTLFGLGVLSLSAVTTAAFAQDSDGDGVANAADSFPCDATRAAVSWFPGDGTSALLTYEDQWPGATDQDFNDLAMRVHFRSERNAAGNVVRLVGGVRPGGAGR